MKNKKIDIEFIRIIACFFVIFNHTQYSGFLLYTKVTPYSLLSFIYISISICCKVAVPLFLGISGANLLKKKECYKDILKKRVLKTLIVLVLFSFISYIIHIAYLKLDFNFLEFIKMLYNFPKYNYAYWYLYSYIGFLILLPFMKKIIENMNDNMYFIVIIIALLFKGIIPIVDSLTNCTINNDFIKSLWILNDVFIYPMMGYWLFKINIERIKKKHILYLWLSNILTIVILCLMTNSIIIDGVDIDTAQEFLSNFVIVNFITIILSARVYFNSLNNQNISKVISNIGSKTFGIYLLHLLLLDRTNIYNGITKYLVDTLKINRMFSSFCGVIMIMIVGYIITAIIKKMPFVRKLV